MYRLLGNLIPTQRIHIARIFQFPFWGGGGGGGNLYGQKHVDLEEKYERYKCLDALHEYWKMISVTPEQKRSER